MTARKPEKIIKLFERNLTPKERARNKAIDECMSYIDELLKPLGEIYEKYKDTFYTGVFRDPNEPKQAMWNAIKTLIDTHRNTSKDKIVRLTHQTRVKIRGYEKAAKALKSAIDKGIIYK